MTTANYYILPKSLESEEGTKEHGRVATRQLPVVGPKTENEPEKRLWKVCAEAASERPIGLEWIAFPFFGVLAFGALAACFSELFHLSNSGALNETVRALLTR